jgi:putative endonuclease
MKKTYCVYIMSNVSKMLYTGVTNDLEHRVFQHKTKEVDGFTKKYNIHRLVYFEVFGEIREAIAREKQIKGWLRAKKSGAHRISESGVERLGAGMDEEKPSHW